MNIFSALTQYAGKWNQTGERNFSSVEKDQVERAEIVPSQYGNSVCFFMKNGAQSFLPLSNDSSLNVGDAVNLDEASLITLSKDGEADITRVKA